MKILQINWVRWIGVLPIALLAWSGVQLLTLFLMFSPLFSDIIKFFYGSWFWLLKEFMFFAAAPYWAVIAGSNFAPRQNLFVALGLASFIAGIQITTSIFLNSIGFGSLLSPYLGSIFFIGSVSLAIFHVTKNGIQK